MSFPKFRLRKSLYLIGQNMGGHDLSSLKFLSGLPKGRQEKIETAFELFCTLEFMGEIDYNKDDVLRELLEGRHRVHLLKKYPLNTPDDLETDAGGRVYSPQEIKQLKKFLTDISESLSHRDFKDLAYFLFDTDADATRGTYSFQEMEQMTCALDLFEKLIAAKLIGPDNLTALYQVLEVIGRNDLCVKIAEYLPRSGAARRRSLKLQSLSSYGSSYSSSSSSSSPSSSMETSRPTTSASHPTSTSSSNSYLAYSPAPPYFDSFDKISRDVGKSSRPSAPPTPSGPPPQNPSIPVHTGHQPQEQPQPQLNMNRPSQGGANYLLPSTTQPQAQAPTPIVDQHSNSYRPLFPQAPTAAVAQQMEYESSQAPPQTSPVANHQVQPVPPQPQPQATPTPNQSSQTPLPPVQQSFVGQAAQYPTGETVMAMEEEGQVDEEMDTGGPVTGGPRSLLEQLEDENQTLKDIAVQQFQLIQELHEEKEQLKKKPTSTSNNASSNRDGLTCYKMDNKPHGIAIVIGNEVFTKNKKRPKLVLGERRGCLSDLYNFKSCFEALKYKVRAYENCFASDIRKIMDGVSSEDHSNYDSFVFCISTHGEDNNYIFGSDGERINVYNLIGQIQACPTLRNKPKLFFIQACRADHTDVSVVSGDGPDTVKPVVNKDADVAIFWATTRSQSAYRSPRDGSWFVASIHKVFTAEAHRLDLVNMMYKVTHIVTEMEGRESSSGETVRQCVETSLQMRGAVYFNVD